MWHDSQDGEAGSRSEPCREAVDSPRRLVGKTIDAGSAVTADKMCSSGGGRVSASRASIPLARLVGTEDLPATSAGLWPRQEGSPPGEVIHSARSSRGDSLPTLRRQVSLVAAGACTPLVSNRAVPLRFP